MQGFFRTLWRPDREEDPERTVIARAANVLQVGEFQLLQLAYAEWHGHELPQSDCGQLFHSYMLHGDTPDWARQYAEWVLRQDEIGLIDSGDPAFHRYDHDYVTHVPQGLRKFCLASMFFVFVFMAALLVAQLSGATATSVLPPYFEPRELEVQR